MAKLKKYVDGVAGAAGAGATGMEGGKFGQFMGNYGGSITQAAGTIMPLLMKKPNPNAKPYKTGSKLIKYQEGNKKTKTDRQVFSDTGYTTTANANVTDADIAAYINAQTGGGQESPSQTAPKVAKPSVKKSGEITGLQQAGIAGSAGALGASLKEYGKTGKTGSTAAKVAGNIIQYLQPVVSAEESIRKSRNTKTGDISYTGALGQFILDQAAAKTGGALVRIPSKTISAINKGVQESEEYAAKTKLSKQEQSKLSKEYYSEKKAAIKADNAETLKRLDKYQEDLKKYNERISQKTRGKKPKPPVEPEPSKLNQIKFSQKKKPLLAFGEPPEYKPISQIVKEAAMEEFGTPGLVKNLLKYSKGGEEAEKAATAKAAQQRAKELAAENRRKFKKLENTFGLSQQEFLGRLKKSEMSFEDFYQDLVETYRSKGISLSGKNVREQRQARKPVVDLTEKLKEQRQLPERREAAQQNLIKKAAQESEQNLIKFKAKTEADKKEQIARFLEQKPAATSQEIPRMRVPFEDITPTPRRSQLLLPESQTAKRQVAAQKAVTTRKSNEKRVGEKVKKIKFYGTGK